MPYEPRTSCGVVQWPQRQPKTNLDLRFACRPADKMSLMKLFDFLEFGIFTRMEAAICQIRTVLQFAFLTHDV